MPLSTLNAEQLSAATAPLGQNLIIASAGTGKTSTIVGRIAHLLQSGMDPSKILLLTFTNKAAGEMIARLERYFPKKIVSKIKTMEEKIKQKEEALAAIPQEKEAILKKYL